MSEEANQSKAVFWYIPKRGVSHLYWEDTEYVPFKAIAASITGPPTSLGGFTPGNTALIIAGAFRGLLAKISGGTRKSHYVGNVEWVRQCAIG